MSSSSARVLIFTRADDVGRALFRPLSMELSVQPGQGRVWLDLSSGIRYSPSWQDHLHHLAAVGRRRYALPWDSTDLRVSVRGSGEILDGRSSSLPLFVAWVALLMDQPLPVPFLSVGVVAEGQEYLAPAPPDLLLGKLSVADAYVCQTYPELGRVPIWVPAGSRWNPASLEALEVRTVESLTDAVEHILGRAPPPAP